MQSQKKIIFLIVLGLSISLLHANPNQKASMNTRLIATAKSYLPSAKAYAKNKLIEFSAQAIAYATTKNKTVRSISPAIPNTVYQSYLLAYNLKHVTPLDRVK